MCVSDRRQVFHFKGGLAAATAASALMLGACSSDAGFTPVVSAPPPPGPPPSGVASGFEGPAAGISIGGNQITGPSGGSTLVGVNVLPEGGSSGTLASVDVLTGDGTIIQVALPTTAEEVENALSPVSGLIDGVAGPEVAAKVDEAVDRLAPGVAGLTSAVEGVTTPVLGSVNEALSPVTDQLLGSLPIVPANGLAGGPLGELPGLSAGQTNFEGQILGANVGPLATGFDGEGTGPVIAVNALQQDRNTPTPLAGQIATLELLSGDKVIDVDLATTPEAIAAGLEPVGNLTGALLGSQAAGVVSEVTSNAAPGLAALTSGLDGALSQATDGLNSVAGEQLSGGIGVLDPILGTLLEGVGGGEQLGDGGNPLAPLDDILAAGGSSPLSPITDALGGSGDNPLAQVTDLLGGDASGPLAPVTGLLSGGAGNLPLSLPSGVGGNLGAAIVIPAAELLGGQETATLMAPVVALLNGQGIEGVTVPLNGVVSGNGLGSLTAPVSGIGQRLTGGLLGGEGAGSLLAPVQSLVEGITGGLLAGVAGGG